MNLKFTVADYHKVLLPFLLISFFSMSVIELTLPEPVLGLPLQGGVSEDVIHPVPDQYRPGQIFDPNSLEKSKVDNWVMVPNWAAGRWTRNVEMIEYADGSRVSRQIQSSTSWGSQIDAANNVWHCYPLPAVGFGQGGGEISYSIWLTQNYSPPRPDVLSYSGEGMSITVDANTRRIKQVVQSRALKVLTPNPDGTITSRSTESAYDELGKRTIGFKGTTVYFKTGPFVPREELRRSFYDYLQANGMSNYIPRGAGE